MESKTLPARAVSKLTILLAFACVLSTGLVGYADDPKPGATKWIPATAPYVMYDFVFNAMSADVDSTGIYRKVFDSSGALIYDAEIVTAEMALVPTSSVKKFTSTNAGIKLTRARSNYALAADSKNHLYIVTAKTVKQINVEGVHIQGERYDILGPNDRRFDAYLFVNPRNMNYDMILIRDDGLHYHVGNGTIDREGRAVLDHPSITTSDELKALFEVAMKQPSQSDAKVIFDESLSKAPKVQLTSTASSLKHQSLLNNPGGRVPGRSLSLTRLEEPTTSSATIATRSSELPPFENVETEGPEGGGMVDAMKVLGSTVTDLGEKVLREKNAPLDIDQDLKLKIARGLTKIQRGNVILLGESGTGKSTDIETLIYDVFVKKDPELAALREYNFINIDLGSLSAGGKYRGMTETKIAAMIKLSKKNKIIWVIDEIHSMRGLGSSSSHDSDMFEYLKAPLASGEFRMIGMSTADRFWPTFGDDSALRRRFTIVNKKAPTGDIIVKIMSSWLKRHKLSEPDAVVLKEVVRLSTEMDPTRAQPDAAISLLEEIYSGLRLKNVSDAPTMEIAREAAVRFYEIDRSLIDPERQIERIKNLQTTLDSRIVGQNHAKKILVSMTKEVLADVHDNKRPRLMALLTGKKGLGKTELVIAYAEGLGLPVKVISMNSYNSAAGFNRIGLMEDIAAALDKNAYTVLLFDELEKAPISIQNELLYMLNNGVFQLTVNVKGQRGVQMNRTIDATKSTVLFTANAGEDHLRDKSKPSIGFVQSKTTSENTANDQEFRKAIELDNISPVLLDRINAVVPFIDNTQENFRDVIALHFDQTIKSIEERRHVQIEVVNKNEFCEAAAAQLFKPNMSNREALRAIQSSVRLILSEALLGKPNVQKLTLVFENGTFSVRLEDSNCAPLLK